MPLRHVRVCDCGLVRFAPCNPACRVPAENDPDSWRLNVEPDAEEAA